MEIIMTRNINKTCGAKPKPLRFEINRKRLKEYMERHNVRFGNPKRKRGLVL